MPAPLPPFGEGSDSMESGEILEEGELPLEVSGPLSRVPILEPRPPPRSLLRRHDERLPLRRGCKDDRPPPPHHHHQHRHHHRSRGGRDRSPPPYRPAPPFEQRRSGGLPPAPQPRLESPPRSRDRTRSRERSRSRPGSGGSARHARQRSASPPPPRAQPDPADEAAGAAREMDDLAAAVRAVERSLTLQACLKDLRGVCDDLTAVVRKAQRFLEMQQQRDSEVAGADNSPVLAELGGVLMRGLKALHVYSSTGQGRSMGAAARPPVRAAWDARQHLLTAAQRQQFEALASSSRNFAALLEEAPPPQEPVRTAYVPAPRPQPQQRKEKQRQRQAEPEEEEPRLSKRQLKRLQAEQRAQAEAAARQAAARQAAAAAAQQQAAAPPLPSVQQQQQQQQWGASDTREGANGKPHKLSFKLGGLGTGADAQPPLPVGLAPEDRQLASALDDHWRWHQQQQVQQQAQAQQRGWSGAAAQQPPLPAGAPLPPSAAAPPLPPGRPPSAAANGEAGAGALGLNPIAVEHAAGGSEAVRKLLGQGKLCLVLDLDHTLLNSATFGEVGAGPVGDLLASRAAAEAANLPPGRRLLFRNDEIKMWTKLRPGVREFLQRASRYFQLWIHTNGNRAYAASVCRLLDPGGEYFADRIVAQGADRVEEMVPDQKKHLMQGLAEREAITLIVDDSHSVWSQHRHNLVAVERYIFFPSSRTSLGLKGPSLLDANRDEHPEQGMLMVALGVLLRVHGAVMAALRAPPRALPGGEVVLASWDVRQALAHERQQVLAGVRIVFTRVIPLEQDPATHPLWRLAESFGASCATQPDAATTHVVAGASGTEKVLAARAAGKWVVTPAWLECSCILWKRAHEERFLVPP